MGFKKVTLQSKQASYIFKKTKLSHIIKNLKRAHSSFIPAFAKQVRLQSINIVSPTVRLQRLSLKKKGSYLNFIDFFSLRYFSYLVGILQRAGGKLLYWRMVSKVFCNVSRVIQLRCKDISSMCGDLPLTEVSNIEEEQSLVSFKLNKVLFFFWTVSNVTLNGLEFYQTQHIFLNEELTQKVTLKIIPLVTAALKMSYMVRYRALDRKLRKIVKNKYRYVRFYTMVNPKNRIKAGLRLFLIGLSLRSNQRLDARLLELLVDIILYPTNSLLLNLRSKHQAITLSTLTLAM